MNDTTFSGRGLRRLGALALALSAATALSACLPDSTRQASAPAADEAMPDIAGENCMKELSRTANQPLSMISILRVDEDETGPTHYLMIQGAAAPWICKTLPNGAVTDLRYSQEG